MPDKSDETGKPSEIGQVADSVGPIVDAPKEHGPAPEDHLQRIEGTLRNATDLVFARATLQAQAHGALTSLDALREQIAALCEALEQLLSATVETAGLHVGTVEFAVGHSGNRELIAKARAALAKARGEQTDAK